MGELVNCLVVTSESRKAFWPWLKWNYDKQSYPNRQLVVVSDGPRLTQEGVWVRVSGNIPKKRNAALGAISGGLAVWMDDDDWQHPRRCEFTAKVARPRHVACSMDSMFIDVFSKRGRHVSYGIPLFNSLGFSVNDAPTFNENIDVASDTPWLFTIMSGAMWHTSKEPLFYWLTHHMNISNPSTKIGAADLVELDEETWQHLKKLEQRLVLD